MNPAELEPGPELAEHVRSFWGLEESIEVYNRDAIIPDSHVELILNCGAPLLWEREDLSLVELPRAFVIGLQRKPLVLRSAGLCRIVGVRLYAWAAPDLTGMAPGALGAPVVPAGDGWERLARDLAVTVDRRGYEEALGILRERMEAVRGVVGQLPEPVRAAGQLLYGTAGQIGIGRLASGSALSLSGLERQFRRYTGVTPKAFARLVRFEAVRDLLVDNPRYRAVDLASDFGFADQAHLIHEFRSFAACTPGEFAGHVLAREGE